MAVPHSRLAIDDIVVGCDWRAVVVVDPVDDQTAADVITALTDATCVGGIVDTDGSTVITGDIAATITAADREIELTMNAATTLGLVPGIYRWAIVVTTDAGKTWPIRMPGFAYVRALS